MSVVHSADPVAALAEVDIDELVADLFASQIEEGKPQPFDDYPDPRQDDEPGDDHALDDGGVGLDFGAIAWGKAIE
jgi:hypothetical protein